MTFVLTQMIHYRFLQVWLLLLIPFGNANTGKPTSPGSNIDPAISVIPLSDNNNLNSIFNPNNNDPDKHLSHEGCNHEDPKERYHRVLTASGDNIFKFLKRYNLHEHQCNFDRFYALNDLNRESQLFASRKYYIPVLIYKYNGKSIRSTIGVDTWEQALRIKRYNERMRKQGHRKMTLTASNILWVAYHELYCLDGKAAPTAPTEPIASDPITTAPKKDKSKDNTTSSTESTTPTFENDPSHKLDPETIKKLESSGGIRKYPIFGYKNSYVRLIDNSLRGKVYYIVSGHGGPDPGAVGKQGKHTLCEDEYAYDVSLRLTRQLLQRGALVYMIIRDKNDGLRSGKYLGQDNDEYCWGNYRIPRSQKKRLHQRSSAVNTLFDKHKKQGIKEQYCVVIHIDSRSTGENTDVFFYHFPGSKAGRKLAKNIHRTFKNKYRIYRKDGRYHGTVTPRDLHMLREPKPTSVFIELGNIRNRNDQKRIVVESNREALAKWLYEGLIVK
ncbi:MAG: N-acetylmuramoyl-L-alanine amidase [Polaribacter sp.]|jgi:N-acetylmuramoyl-L-alanine amidase